jgi:hypothetical protein
MIIMCVVCRIMKLDNLPHILWRQSPWNVTVKRFLIPLCDISIMIKLPMATSKRTVLLHTKLVVSMTLLCDVFGDRIILKGIWRSWLFNPPPHCYLWRAMKGIVYKDYLHTLLELKETTANSIRIIPPTELSHLHNQGKTCRCVTTIMQGAISNIFCNLSMRNVFILMYRDWI